MKDMYKRFIDTYTTLWKCIWQDKCKWIMFWKKKKKLCLAPTSFFVSNLYVFHYIDIDIYLNISLLSSSPPFWLKKSFPTHLFFNASTTTHFTYCFLFWMTIMIVLVVFYLVFNLLLFVWGSYPFCEVKGGNKFAKKKKIKVTPKNWGAL